MSVNILALDLGTTTGYALFAPPGAVISGSWSFKPGKYDGAGMRFVRFVAKLDEMHRARPIGQVWFEAVRRHKGTDAAHIYGGLMSHLQAWCETKGIPYGAETVQAIKKSWAGKGNASKAAMIAVAREKGYEVVDDNEADALALLDMKLKETRDAAQAE